MSAREALEVERHRYRELFDEAPVRLPGDRRARGHRGGQPRRRRAARHLAPDSWKASRWPLLSAGGAAALPRPAPAGAAAEAEAGGEVEVTLEAARRGAVPAVLTRRSATRTAGQRRRCACAGCCATSRDRGPPRRRCAPARSGCATPSGWRRSAAWPAASPTPSTTCWRRSPSMPSCSCEPDRRAGRAAATSRRSRRPASARAALARQLLAFSRKQVLQPQAPRLGRRDRGTWSRCCAA